MPPIGLPKASQEGRVGLAPHDPGVGTAQVALAKPDREQGADPGREGDPAAKAGDAVAVLSTGLPKAAREGELPSTFCHAACNPFAAVMHAEY